MRLLMIVKGVICSPILFYSLLVYKWSNSKSLIDADILRFGYSKWDGLAKLLLGNKEFRNIFYYRVGFLAAIINTFLRKNPTLHIMTEHIGEGLIVVHGDATYINAKSIGKNFYVNQCVTIGVIGEDAPVIGNDVRVATGAIVIGNITIGNNVLIGAGAVVVKSIPGNCTVIGNPARIVKRNGVRVDEML